MSDSLGEEALHLNGQIVSVLTIGLFGVVRTTWFVWSTTWLVPENPFAPLGLNSNYDSATVHLQGPPRAIYTFEPLGLLFLARTLRVVTAT